MYAGYCSSPEHVSMRWPETGMSVLNDGANLRARAGEGAANGTCPERWARYWRCVFYWELNAKDLNTYGGITEDAALVRDTGCFK